MRKIGKALGWDVEFDAVHIKDKNGKTVRGENGTPRRADGSIDIKKQAHNNRLREQAADTVYFQARTDISGKVQICTVTLRKRLKNQSCLKMARRENRQAGQHCKV